MIGLRTKCFARAERAFKGWGGLGQHPHKVLNFQKATNEVGPFLLNKTLH
jgi:hypothetical protein